VLPKIESVLGVYDNSTDAHREHGMRWYLDAHEFCETLDPGNVSRAAGIVAALSPMSHWENNKNKAAQLYRQDGEGTGVGLFRNVEKAQRIFKGENPLDVLGGDKVRAFYECILYPDLHSSKAVIDRHAFDIAVGKRTDDKTRGILGRKGVYDSFAEVYCEAAKSAGIGAAQMQAVTWVAWREVHAIV